MDNYSRASALSATTITTIPKASHEPQHWHYHPMTEVISSTSPTHSPPGHRSHHNVHSHLHPNLPYTIRHGDLADLKAIHKIYTYYALNSSITLLVHAPPIRYIEKAYEASISRHMPYLVAITRFSSPNTTDPPNEPALDHRDSQLQSSDVPEPYLDKSDPPVITEVVLGYGQVTPLHADKAGYGPAVELTIYIHPSYLTFGIGSALLSALETELRQHPILVIEDGHHDDASERLAEVVVARMSNDLERDFEGVKMIDGEPNGEGGNGTWPVWKAQGEKNKEWYLRKGFEEVGRMKRVGEKFGKK